MSSQLNSMGEVTITGIDNGKTTLHLIGQDKHGRFALQTRVSRTKLMERLVNVPPCLVGLEAGAASLHIARRPKGFGHHSRAVRGRPLSIAD